MKPSPRTADERSLVRLEPGLAAWLGRIPVLAPITPEPFDMVDALARSILHQQLAGNVARTIVGRVEALLGSDRLSAEGLSRASEEELRGCGLSRAKVAAVKDLAGRAADLPDHAAAATMSNAELVSALTVVRGIGPWTVQMLLLFRLGRPDVWPADDFGVRQGLALIRGRSEALSARQAAAAGEGYGKLASLMARSCWAVADRCKLERRTVAGEACR